MKRFVFIGICGWFVGLGLASLITASGSASARPKPLEILYVTDYSDFWHDYAAQAEFFQDTLPRYANLEISIVGKTAKAAKAVLMQPDFAEGFDAIFYNACHADTEELDLTNELFRQVREQGMPILFFHCAMHNFRKTSSQPGLLDRLSLRKLKQWWSQQFPSLDFPVWWQLTGIDSTSHAFPQKLVLEKEATRHPITEQLPQVWASPRDELYLSHKELDDIQVLYRSSKTHKGQKQAVAWVREDQGSRIFATTLGHDQQTLDQPTFQQLIANGLLWITGRLTEQGLPEAGYEGF